MENEIKKSMIVMRGDEWDGDMGKRLGLGVVREARPQRITSRRPTAPPCRNGESRRGRKRRRSRRRAPVMVAEVEADADGGPDEQLCDRDTRASPSCASAAPGPPPMP